MHDGRSEHIGSVKAKHPSHLQMALAQARVRGLQTPRTTHNAQVETTHNTIALEILQIQRFLDWADILAKASSDQLWSNCGRSNCNRHDQSPLDTHWRVAPKVDPRILLLPTLDPDALVDHQVTSIVAATRRGGRDVPGHARWIAPPI